MKINTHIKRKILNLIRKLGYDLKGIKKKVIYNDFDSIISFLLKDKKNILIFFGAVGETRTLTRKPTRPSSVPVYQFQHDRIY